MKTTLENPENLFFERSKLLIMTELVGSNCALSFTEIQKDTNLTRGNLSSHLKKLENAKLVNIKKQFVDRKPLTLIELTAKGRKAFRNHLEGLKDIISKLGE